MLRCSDAVLRSFFFGIPIYDLEVKSGKLGRSKQELTMTLQIP